MQFKQSIINACCVEKLTGFFILDHQKHTSPVADFNSFFFFSFSFNILGTNLPNPALLGKKLKILYLLWGEELNI